MRRYLKKSVILQRILLNVLVKSISFFYFISWQLLIYQLMNFLRQIVSGKKNRMMEAGYNLDLTYVCPRVIAMSFPAEGFEITFRNNISDVRVQGNRFVFQVVSFVKERHGNDFHIYNLSGRPYDISKFDGQVSDFAWEDHHSPPIHILFTLCKSVDDFLARNSKKISNVISIHCLAGKGRTGTAICCYLLYCGRFNTAEDVLLYYAKKRFLKGGGVTQPSQRRYVKYFESLLLNWHRSPQLKYITSVTLGGIPAFQKNKSCRPFIEIYNVKENKLVLIYTDKTQVEFKMIKKRLEEIQAIAKVYGHEQRRAKFGKSANTDSLRGAWGCDDQSLPSQTLIDRYKSEPMFRFAFNTAFLTEDNAIKFDINQLDPDKIRRDARYPKDFYVEVKLTDYCKCTSETPFEEKCKDCSVFMPQVRPEWETIYSIMKDYERHPIEESKIMLFGDPDFDDYNEILYTKQMPIAQQVQEEEYDEEEEEEKRRNDNRRKNDSFFKSQM